MYDGGIALQPMHLRKSHREPVPPTTKGSLRRQEMQKHDIDCYSDCGYPTRPRPKVVLSIPRPGSPWSAHHASKLQTFPIRVCQLPHSNGTAQRRKQRASIGTPFQSARDISSEKTNTERRRRHQRIRSVGATATDIESCGSVSESEGSCVSSVAGYDYKSASGRLKTKASVAPLEPLALSRVKGDRHSLSQSWPCREEDENDKRRNGYTTPPSTEMSNHSRAHARKHHATETHRETDRHASHGTSPRSGKKTRKPSRALTFSFGSSSDKVRRGLGFLHSKVTRKQHNSEAEPTSPFLKLPESNLATPNSPILQSKRKSQTLPAISRSTEFQRHNILEERDSEESSGEDWGPDLNTSHRDRLTGKRIPPPKSLVLGSSPSLPSELTNGMGSTAESPNYSPNSAFSSRRESFDSQCSSPMSRQDSPNMLTMPKLSRKERRKYSDPDLCDRENGLGNGVEQTSRGTTLKKRYTFCVRPTKQSPRPGWVSKRQLYAVCS